MSQHFGILLLFNSRHTDRHRIDRSNPTPRWRLIEDYLAACFTLTEEEQTRLARLVAAVLDQASAERGPRLLVPEHPTACAICRLPFRRSRCLSPR